MCISGAGEPRTKTSIVQSLDHVLLIVHVHALDAVHVLALVLEPARSRHTKSIFPNPGPTERASRHSQTLRVAAIAVPERSVHSNSHAQNRPWASQGSLGRTAHQVTSLKVAQKSMKPVLSRLLCRDVAVWTRLRCPLSALHGGAAPFCTDFVSEHLQALAHRESPQNSQNPRCARRGWVCEALTEILAVVS